MANIKRVITYADKYITDKKVAKQLANMLADKGVNVKIRTITDSNYAIEIINYEDVKSEISSIAEDMYKSVNCKIYRTSDTWKELKRRQLERDTRQLEIQLS